MPSLHEIFDTLKSLVASWLPNEKVNFEPYLYMSFLLISAEIWFNIVVLYYV